jgi:LmbE family N-acetylglucosaminyl deacetylase
VRRGESIAATAIFGLNENDIISLGYPDFGTMDVMARFWGDTKPLRSMLSRVRQVPYENAYSPGAPYVGESILRDLKAIIFSFKPTKVFVSHPADVNRDHRAFYLFTKVALWDLDGRIEQPEVYPYIVHVVGWPKPRGYHPDLVLGVPSELEQSTVPWHYLKLDPEEVEKKHEAILRYISQNKYAPNYLVTFSRQNEFFGDYPPIAIMKQMVSQIQWQYVTTGGNINAHVQSRQPDQISLLGYARQGNDLLVRVTLRQEIEKEIGLTLYFFGYSRNTPFSQMPKISLDVNLSGLTIKDKNHRLPAKSAIYTSEGKVLTFRIPLSILGNPERILTTAKTSVYNLTLDETAWRELDLN